MRAILLSCQKVLIRRKFFISVILSYINLSASVYQVLAAGTMF